MDFTFTLGDKEKTEVQLRRHQFTVGKIETFDIRVIHTWPERFPAFKRQKYDILANGELIKTVVSY